MDIQQYLDDMREELQLNWLVVTNDDGLHLLSSGVSEPPNLASMLPDWLEASDKIVKSAHLDRGLGFVCLVPRGGDYLLLVTDIKAEQHTMFLMLAAKRMPAKPAQVLAGISQQLKGFFLADV